MELAPSTDPESVRTFESAAADALRPAVDIVVDGWRFRTDPSGTRRGNSVLPERAGIGPLRARVHTIEQMYRARRATPRFQLTSDALPSGLVDLLTSDGWRVEPGAHVLVRSCAPSVHDRERGLEAEVTWERGVDRRSGSDLVRWRGSVRVAGAGVVATGTVVGDEVRSVVGLFSLETDRAWRSRGLGSMLVRSALALAHEEGIGRAYLQVDVRNDGARRLYERLGFVFHHAYAYAERPTGDERSSDRAAPPATSVL